MTMVKGVMIAINRGEPTLIFWRLEDLPEALPPRWEISYSTAPGRSPSSSSEARCAPGRT